MLPESIAIVMAPRDNSRLYFFDFLSIEHCFLTVRVLKFETLNCNCLLFYIRKHGIFRLTSGGMTVIRQCPRRGFHSHDPTSDGSPIYSDSTDIYMNPSLKFDVIDLR